MGIGELEVSSYVRRRSRKRRHPYRRLTYLQARYLVIYLSSRSRTLVVVHIELAVTRPLRHVWTANVTCYIIC